MVLAMLLTLVEPGFERAGEHRVRRHAHFYHVGAKGAGQGEVAP